MAQSNPPKPEAIYGQGAKSFKLATGSPGELDLLQALGEAFDKKKAQDSFGLKPAVARH